MTSWNELRRDGLRCDEAAFLHPESEAAGAVGHPEALRTPGSGRGGVATTCAPCRTRSAQWVPGDFTSLGADGFGFSDTRPAARRFFHIDGPSMAVRTLQRWPSGARSTRGAAKAAEKYRLPDVTAGHLRQRGRRVLGPGLKGSVPVGSSDRYRPFPPGRQPAACFSRTSSATALGIRVSKSRILAQVGVIRISTIES